MVVLRGAREAPKAAWMIRDRHKVICILARIERAKRGEGSNQYLQEMF